MWSACQQRLLKTFPGSGYLHFDEGVVWLWLSLVKLYIWLTILSCYGLRLIWRHGGLSTLCHSCWFVSQHMVVKIFSGPGYRCREDGVFWLYDSLVILYIWLTILSCYRWNHLAFKLIWRNGSQSILCHSCGFACQQRILKFFSASGYLRCKQGVISQWHSLVNLYIWLTILSFYGVIPLVKVYH